MSSIRGSNSTIQDSLFNNTNMTNELTPFINYSSYDLNNIILYIGIVIILLTIIGFIINYKMVINNKSLNIPNMVKWIRDRYGVKTIKHILPVYYSKKAKQSPFIGSQPTPIGVIPRLENDKNLQVRFSIPYRRYQSSENLEGNQEHRITITTVVQKIPENTKV